MIKFVSLVITLLIHSFYFEIRLFNVNSYVSHKFNIWMVWYIKIELGRGKIWYTWVRWVDNIAVAMMVVQTRSWRVLMWPKEKEYWVWRTKLEVLQYRTGRSRILQKRMTNKMIFKRVMICSHPLENFINFREQPLTTKMFLLVLRKYYVTVIFLSMVLLMTMLKLIFWDQVFLIYACISIILCLINTIKTFTICGYNNSNISEAISELQNVVG